MSSSGSVAAYTRRYPKGHWSFLGPGTEENWYGTHTCNHVADLMMGNLRESGHPAFGGTSALSQGSWTSTRGGKTLIHYNGIQRQQSCYFAQLFPSISSVSTEQYRTGVKNLLRRFQLILQLVQGNPVAKMNDESESKVAPTVMSILTSSLLINFPVQGNLVRQHNE